MKLVSCELANAILSDENMVTEWIVESPNLFSQYVQELLQQCEGGDGQFVLSHNNKIIEISKYMEIIFNPFSVEINSKKILTKLYSDLDKLAQSEEMYLQTRQLIQVLTEYLLELEQKSEHILTFEQEIDLTLLFKATGIRHEIIGENYFEKLIRYIRIVSSVLTY